MDSLIIPLLLMLLRDRDRPQQAQPAQPPYPPPPYSYPPQPWVWGGAWTGPWGYPQPQSPPSQPPPQQQPPPAWPGVNQWAQGGMPQGGAPWPWPVGIWAQGGAGPVPPIPPWPGPGQGQPPTTGPARPWRRIRSGDTGYGLAQRATGAGGRWRELLDVNPELTTYTDAKKQTQIKPWQVGQKIYLPPGWERVADGIEPGVPLTPPTPPGTLTDAKKG